MGYETLWRAYKTQETMSYADFAEMTEHPRGQSFSIGVNVNT